MNSQETKMKILYTEWLKIKSYWAFWLVMLCTGLSYPGVNYLFWHEYKNLLTNKNTTGQVLKMLLGNPFEFPETFHTAAFFSSVFVFIPALVVIMLITNEYTYKTSRQNIIDGWSREKFLLGKFFDVVIITFTVTVIFAIVATVIGNIATTKEVVAPWSKAHYILLFALQTFSQLSFAFMVGFIVRRSFIALGVFMFYFVIIENAVNGLSRQYKWAIGKYMPIEISDRIIPPPAFMRRFDEAGYKASLASVDTYIIYTILLTVGIWLLCYFLNKIRDL